MKKINKITDAIEHLKGESVKTLKYQTKQNLSEVNPRSLLEKIVTRSLKGGGSIGPPPSTFDTIHPIDLKFGTYNKLHLHFQLGETTCCLIGFHGNNK